MKASKRIIIFLLIAALLCGGMSFGVSAADPMDAILGVYEGYYYAHQGQTGVTLTVYKNAEGGVEAIYEFYNLPDRTNAKEGSYYMSVSYEDGSYFFDATSWIDKPSGYSTLDLRAKLDGYVLSGNVLYSYGTSFSFYAEKANDSYENVQESIYNDHRYELVEEGMTWTEAQAYAASKGGYLAVITSAEEQAYIERLISGGEKLQYWIGASRESGSWAWVNGEGFDYSKWDAGQPNNYGRGEDYAQICRVPNPYYYGSKAMHWNDINNENTISGEEDYFSLSNVGFIIEYGVWSDSSVWADPELEEAYEKGLIPDVLIGEDLTKPITRGEFAAVAVKLYEAMTGNRTIIAMDAGFTDIDDCAERLYILKAYNYQIVNGISATAYAPDQLLTREQMATMLTRVVKKATWPSYTIAADGDFALDYSGVTKFKDDSLISAYAYGSVYFMVKNGIINGMGNGCFAPRNTTDEQSAIHYANATRQQALLISIRSLENLG